MNLSTWSIRNPIPVILFFLLLSLAGLWGFNQLGVQDFPDLDPPGVNVVLKLPGVTPAQLETEVAKKVEDKIAVVRNIKYLNTTISEGQVTILVQFSIGASLVDGLQEVKDAIDSVKGDLPKNLEEPEISKVTIGPGGPTLTYAVTHNQLDEEALSWFTDDTIEKVVMSVPGVGKFSRLGGVQREIQVHVSPTKLNALGVTALDVSRALKQVQQDVSGGRGQFGGSEQGVRTIAALNQADDLKTLPIALADGRSLKLNEVAEVYDTVADRSQVALFNGVPAVGFQISRNKGVDEINLDKAIKLKFKDLEEANPGLKFRIVKSTVDHTREQYQGSMQMLYEGAILAILVIWWFLRDWRATIIGAAALPLSILPTFAYMAWAGYTLNTITLLALAVVVGVLVDDAIVEVENISRHLRMGKSVREATESAVNEIWVAVLATTAALVVVFLPTAFMSGTPGLVFKQFGWTVVISVLASLIVARLATPLMAIWLLKKEHKQETDSGLMRWYLRLAEWCLQHRLKTLMTATLLFVCSIALVPLMTTGFIPASDKGYSAVDIELPPGSSLSSSLAIAEEIRNSISGIEGIKDIFVTAGTPQVAGAATASVGEVRKATLTLIFDDRTKRLPQQQIENEVRKKLQNISGIRWSISADGPGEKLQLIFASQDAKTLKLVAESVAKEMRANPNLSGITSNASLERPEITIRPNAARAAELGVTTQSIGDTLRVATSGDFSSSLSKLNLDNRQLDIVVRLPDSVRQDPLAVAMLNIPSREGVIPLESVAKISLESGPSEITRFNRMRNVTISADLGGYSLSEALLETKSLPTVKNLPTSVVLVESGDAEVMKDLFSGFALALFIGVLCKYCVLVLLYKDWFQPFTNLSALPLSVGGALTALLIFSGELNLPALIGIVMLFGVVTKNSILIVDYAFIAMRDKGMNEKEAFLDACHKRARPIMMTTVAMVAGMLPIALGFGGDASFRQPMAIAVIGGLIASTALSLIVVPVVSTYISSLENLLKFNKRKSNTLSIKSFKNLNLTTKR